MSLRVNDSYQSGSAGMLNTIFRYTRFDSNAHGQGSDDMTSDTSRVSNIVSMVWSSTWWSSR